MYIYIYMRIGAAPEVSLVPLSSGGCLDGELASYGNPCSVKKGR